MSEVGCKALSTLQELTNGLVSSPAGQNRRPHTRGLSFWTRAKSGFIGNRTCPDVHPVLDGVNQDEGVASKNVFNESCFVYIFHSVQCFKNSSCRANLTVNVSMECCWEWRNSARAECKK